MKVTCQYKTSEYAIAQVDHPVLLSYVKNIHACIGEILQTGEAEVVGVTNEGHAAKEVEMLNLENRVIPKLPPKLSSFFGNIRVLYLHSVQLTEVSSADFDYPRLNYLSLSKNKLTSLDADLFKNIPKLRVFSVVDNPLTQVGRNLLDTVPLLTNAYFYRTSCIQKLPSSILNDKKRLEILKQQLQENCEPTAETVAEVKYGRPISNLFEENQGLEEDMIDESPSTGDSEDNIIELIVTEPPEENVTSPEPQKPHESNADYFANVQLEETDYDDFQSVETKKMPEPASLSAENLPNDDPEVEIYEIEIKDVLSDDSEARDESRPQNDSQEEGKLQDKGQQQHESQPQDDSQIVQNAKKLQELDLFASEDVDDLRRSRKKHKRNFEDDDEDDEGENFRLVPDFITVTHNYDNDADY